MNESDNFIIRILKNEPPLKGDNAQDLPTWFSSIRRFTYGANVELDPKISLRLMWIWESQVKGIVLENLEK